MGTLTLTGIDVNGRCSAYPTRGKRTAPDRVARRGTITLKPSVGGRPVAVWAVLANPFAYPARDTTPHTGTPKKPLH